MFYLFIPPITSESPNLNLLTLFKGKYLPYWMASKFTTLTHTYPQVSPQFLFSSINCTSIYNHCSFAVPSFVSSYDYFPYQHNTLHLINMSCYLRRNFYTLCVVIFSWLMDEGLSLLTFTHKYSLAPWIDVSSRECYKKFTWKVNYS